MGKEVEKIALERGHELILRIENNEEYDIFVPPNIELDENGDYIPPTE